MTDEKIGDLNGKWSILFRYLLAALAFFLPAVLALNVWFVTTIHDMRLEQRELRVRFDNFASVGPRYTSVDARADHAQWKGEIMEAISKAYPPEWLTREVESLGRRIDSLEKRSTP